MLDNLPLSCQEVANISDLVVKTSFLLEIDTPSVAYVPVWVKEVVSGAFGGTKFALSCL